MSYTAPPPPPFPMPEPSARSRPGAVTAAVWLMYLIALLLALSAAMGLMVAGATRDALEQAYAEVSDQATRDAAVAVGSAVVIILSAIMLLAAAGFAVLGYLDGKGSNAARIITWVLAGLSLCCLGFGAVSAVGGGSFGNMGGGSGGTDMPSGDEVQRAMEAHLPSWYASASTGVQVLALLASLAVIILLALPAANAFFRKQPPQFEPPPYPG